MDEKGKCRYRVKTWDIPQYLTEPWLSMVNFYWNYKAFGSPWGGRGWLEWPCWAYDIITALSGEDIHDGDR